jgi:hypothetical protein
MSRRSLITPAVLLAIVVLSGCTAGSPIEPSASVAPTSAAASAYTCDDIAALDDVAPVFVTADGTAPTPVAAIQPAFNLIDYAVPALGGLSCSWRVGPAVTNPLLDPVDFDWAYVSVKVVPAGADSWAPYTVGYDALSFGDGPSDTAMTIGGIDAATGCGYDTGCFISAPVGDAWVEIALSTNWIQRDSWYFSGLTPDAILAQMQPLAASVFTALTDAQPGQLVWPAVDLVDQEPDCTRALGSQGIATALGVDSLEYEVRSTANGSTSFENYVAQRAGVFHCEVNADVPADLIAAGVWGTSVTVGYDLAGLVDTMVSTPDTQALPTIALKGAVEGEHAVQICSDMTPLCMVVFSLGQSAYQVESTSDTVAIAEAIIAHTR